MILTFMAARPAAAQVADPQRWVGEWRGEVTTRIDESCGEGGRYTVKKQKVRFRITLTEDGKVSASPSGGNMPLTLPSASYSAVTQTDGILVRDEPPVTVSLSRQGLKLRYSGELQTRCGGLESGTLLRVVSSGIEECDDLLAIHMSAGWCPSFPQEARPGYVDLRSVKKLRGRARVQQRQLCAEAVTRTWSLLIQSGCFGSVAN